MTEPQVLPGISKRFHCRPTTCWPSREEWAQKVRRIHCWQGDYDSWEVDYFGKPNPNPAPSELRSYAAGEEIDALIVGLKKLYKERGLALKKAKQDCADLVAGGRRDYWNWPKSDQERYLPVLKAQLDRRTINRAIKRLRDGAIPRLLEDGCDLLTISEIGRRYDAARETARQRWLDSIAHYPIDDAAWARELERRRKIDDRRRLMNDETERRT